MKKTLILFVSVVFLFLFSGCDKIKEYDGVDIKTLTFETVEYHGGYITTYIFDFINNNVRKSGFLPLPDETEERVFETIATFTMSRKRQIEMKSICFGSNMHNVICGGYFFLFSNYRICRIYL